MRVRLLTALFTSFALLSLAPSLLAQAPATTTPLSAEIPESDLTPERITARIDQLKQSADLDEPTRAIIIAAYEQAATDLRAVSDWNARLAAFAAQRESAPGGIEQIRADLAKPIEVPPIQPPADATLPQLEQLLAQADANLKNRRDQLKALDDELVARPERIAKLPAEIAAAKQELADLLKAADAAPPDGESPLITAARKTARPARRRLLDSKIKTLEEDIARSDWLVAIRDRAARETLIAEKTAQAWQSLVNNRRKADAEAAATAARAAQDDAARSHPIVAQWAEQNAALARERTELVAKIEKAAAETSRLAADLDALRERSAFVTSKSEAAGLTIEIGPLLLQAREQLADLREMRRSAAKRRNEMSAIAVRQIELGDDRRAIGDLNVRLREQMKQLDPRPADDKRDPIQSALRDLLTARIDLLDKLKADHETYGKSLVSLLEQQELVIQSTEAFADYIDEHILWVRSTELPSAQTASNLVRAILWITSAKRWRDAGQSLLVSSFAAPASVIGGILIFVGIATARRKMGQRISEIGKAAEKSQAMRFTPTIEALLLTILIAAHWPFLLWFLGARLAAPYDAPDFAKALGLALQTTAQALLAIEFIRQVCRPNGLAEAHFGWSPKPLRTIRRTLSLIAAGGIPAILIVLITMNWTGDLSHLNSLGRLAFILGMALAALLVRRFFHPDSDVLREIITHHPNGILARFRRTWYALAIITPFILMALSIAGYHYSALQLARRLQLSAWLVLALIMLSALALRAILVSKRRMALDLARQRRAAEQAQQAERAERQPHSDQADSSENPATLPEPGAEPLPDLSSIGAQTMALLRATLGLAFILGIWAVWVDVVPALAILDRIELWQSTATITTKETGPDGAAIVREIQRLEPITLANIGLALIAVLAMIIGARNIPGLLEIALLQRLPLRSAERYAITTVARYLITIAGIVAAFSLLGVDWSNVQWLAAAITVGLGFGLQEIFANFVSGLIVLFEQPVRLGDIVTVGDVTGTVTKIRMRATTIADPNKKELIVPNKEFVTSRIMNWSLSDKLLRVVVKLGVAYGSDTIKARGKLLQAAKENPRVLDDPPPTAHFVEFGPSALHLELRAFVSGINDWVAAGDELHTAIDESFKQAGIEVAFNQLDLHVKRWPSHPDHLP